MRDPMGAGIRRRPSVAILTVVAALAASTLVAGEGARTSTDPEIASTPALNQYRALRRMHATTQKFGHEAWMEAWTELDGRTFRYNITSERGSESVRKKLKELLERERELYASGEPDRSDLTSANYEFTAGSPGPGCKYVDIKPKRKDSLLVDGRLVLSEDGELLRVEGKLSKNPSFWTSLVRVVRRFARLDGVRVPITTESTAKVKFIGDAKLRVEYEYETINGRRVSSEARRVAASAIQNGQTIITASNAR